MKKVFLVFSTISFLMVLLTFSSPSVLQAATEPVFTLDHFPLNEGAEWVYSISPSTIIFDFEGDTFTMNFTDFEISIPADGGRRLETTFSGSVDGYSFNGDVWYEEEYVIDGDQIRLASEEGTLSLHVPSADAGVTISATGSLLSPLTLFEHGMEVGESLSFSGTEHVEVTVDYREGSTHEVDTESTDVSISGTAAVVGEGETAFNEELLDTIELQTESLIDGEPSLRTWHLARFIGPVSMEGDVLPVFEDFLQDTEQITCTLKSTNLPVWDIIDTYAVDAGTGDFIEFPYNSGNVSIEIPAGCLSDSTTLTAGDISNIPDSPGVNGITWAVGLTIDDPGVTLSCPMTVMLPYTQADLDAAGVTDPSDLVVYRWSSVSSGWEALSVTAVDTDDKTVSVEISQLSVFGIGAPIDVTAPVVASTTPVNGANNVSVNTVVTAAFSEPMKASTINETTFVVNDGLSNIAATVTYGDMTATFTPTTSLAYDTTYTATMTTGVSDPAGNPMAADYSWLFTTENAPEDTTPPTVLSTSPTDGATSVSVLVAISVTFSEPMDASTIDETTFLLNDGGGNIAGAVTYDDMTASFTPTTNLAYDTTYTAIVTADVQDLAGNPLQEPYEWSFTTQVEADSPVISSTDPVEGADDISVGTVITATFSEEMDPSTITIDTFVVNDGTSNIPGTVTYDDMTAIFTPAKELAFKKTYTATITTGAEDLAGNPLENEYVWSFTTNAGFTLDHFPLGEGSEWVYSMSPSTGTFEVIIDYEVFTFNMTFSELTVSIPSDGHRRIETTFSGTINGYSFSGSMWNEEEYIMDSGQIQFASEEGYLSMSIPSEDASMTVSLTGTFLSPLTLFEDGMEVGESISFSGTERVDMTLDYREGSAHETDDQTEYLSISGTTTIVGQEEVVFNGELVDTVKVQMDSMVNGEAWVRAFHLAPFVGPMRMQGAVSGFEEFFENIDPVTYTLESTNLPVWDIIDTYAVDASTGAVLDFGLNGSMAEIDIPANCLSDSCTVTVGDISNIPDAPGVDGITWAVGIDIDNPDVTFNCPIMVTLPYTQADLDDAGVSDPSNLKVYRWSAPSSGWESLEVVAVDTDNQTVSIEVLQLSVFGLGAPAPRGGGGSDCFIGSAGKSLWW